MTLPFSGNPIKASQIDAELGVAANTAVSIAQATSRALAGIASGPIKFSNLYGKSRTLTVDVLIVAGGGGGGVNGGYEGGGGGGAGGVVYATSSVILKGSFSASIGSGGGQNG